MEFQRKSQRPKPLSIYHADEREGFPLQPDPRVLWAAKVAPPPTDQQSEHVGLFSYNLYAPGQYTQIQSQFSGWQN